LPFSVELRWVEQALEEFKGGKPKIYFGTDGGLGKVREMPIKAVYFKLTRLPGIRARAHLIEILEKDSPCPPAGERLAGGEGAIWKFYYGFDQLEMLSEPILLSDHRRYPSSKVVREDFPGPCVIEDEP
jgi:hypothetical protein